MIYSYTNLVKAHLELEYSSLTKIHKYTKAVLCRNIMIPFSITVTSLIYECMC